MAYDMRLNGHVLTVWFESEGVKHPIYQHRDMHWIEAKVGQAYQVAVMNRSSKRVEVVEAVDDRDVLSNQPASFAGRSGMIVGPGATWYNGVWRVSTCETETLRFADPYDPTRRLGLIRLFVYEEESYDEGDIGAFMRAEIAVAETNEGSPLITRKFRRRSSFPVEIIDVMYRTREWLERIGIEAREDLPAWVKERNAGSSNQSPLVGR